MEDKLGWKTTLDRRRPWMEDDFGWKIALDGRQPWMDDGLGWIDILPSPTPAKRFRLSIPQNYIVAVEASWFDLIMCWTVVGEAEVTGEAQDDCQFRSGEEAVCAQLIEAEAMYNLEGRGRLGSAV